MHDVKAIYRPFPFFWPKRSQKGVKKGCSQKCKKSNNSRFGGPYQSSSLVFFRYISSCGKQEIPEIGGFISLIGVVPKQKTTIEYYEPIHFPITNYETVEELLKRSEEASNAVEQKYVINTFDLGVCLKELPLVWKDPQKYKSHAIFPGAFHTKMNYIKMLTGKKARGSGYAEILLESRLVEPSGCLKSVLSGKAFSKALFNLKATVEALDRLLFEVFVEEHQDSEIRPQALLDLIKKCSRTQLDATLGDVSTMQLLNLYKTFKEKVCKGHLGKTGRFWISFMDDANLVFLLIHAAKTNNRMLFHKCNGEMANLFFAFDGQNYSR